jgi:hypothetical protein
MRGSEFTRSIIKFKVCGQCERDILAHNFVENNEIMEVKSFTQEKDVSSAAFPKVAVE